MTSSPSSGARHCDTTARDVPGDVVRAALTETAERYAAASSTPEARPLVAIVAGGARMASLGLRDASPDVDVLTPLPAPLCRCADEAGTRFGLPPRWLNSNAAAFAPATLRRDDLDVLAASTAVRFVGAAVEDLFVMKLARAARIDRADMSLLWPLCSFTDPAAAASAFREAYPDQPEDPYLEDFVASLVHRA